MADGIRETVRELLDEGYAPEEIRTALRQEGYNMAVVDQVLEELTANRRRPAGSSGVRESSSTLWRAQQYSWIGAFLVVLLGYVVVAMWPMRVQTLPQPVVMGVLGIVGLVFGVHLVAGLYWAVQRDMQRAGISIGSVLFTAGLFGAAGFLVRAALRDFPSLFGAPGGAPAVSFGLVPWMLNAGVLVMGIVTAVYMYRRFGRVAFGFPMLFLVVFAGVWGVQYMQVTGAAAAIEPPSFTTSVVGDEAGDRQQLLRSAAHMPPPFTKFSASMAVVADVGGTFMQWSSLYKEARSVGRVDPPLTAPGEVCGGTNQNIRDRYQDHVRVVLATFETFVIDQMEENKAAAVYGFERRCAHTNECGADRATIRDDVDTYVQWQKTRLEAYKDLFGVSLKDAPQRVDDCSPPPEQYYGVELQDISCIDPFTAELAYTGTRPMTSAVKVYIRGRDGDLAAADMVTSVSDWASGTETVSSTRLVDQLTDTDGFKPGEPYRVEIDFDETDMGVSAYCVGGAGFCENCRVEPRPTGQGYDEMMLVR